MRILLQITLIQVSVVQLDHNFNEKTNTVKLFLHVNCCIGKTSESLLRKKMFHDSDLWYYKGIQTENNGKTDTAIECYK